MPGESMRKVAETGPNEKRAKSERGIKRELKQHIDPRIAQYWNKKVETGIIPTEVLQKSRGGKIDFKDYDAQTARLVNFQVETVAPIIMSLAEQPPDRRRFTDIHNFGIGLGKDLLNITLLANRKGRGMIAYDICRSGCQNARNVFKAVERELMGHPTTIGNRVLQADVEYASDERFIHPDTSELIIASRVLDVLDNPEQRLAPEGKPRGNKLKMRRTAERMGALLKFLKIFLIHLEPEGNERAIFSDGNPSPLDLIAEYMQDGLGEQVRLDRLDRIDYCGHWYTAALLQKQITG